MSENKKKEVVRMKEINELRSADCKVFEMSDGSRQAVFYANQVHTLMLDAEEKHYVNENGCFCAKFNC